MPYVSWWRCVFPVMTAPTFLSLDVTAESAAAGAREPPRNCDPQVVTNPSRSKQSFNEIGIPQRGRLSNASELRGSLVINSSVSCCVQASSRARYTFLPAFELARLRAASTTSRGFARLVLYCSRRSQIEKAVSELSGIRAFYADLSLRNSHTRNRH